MKLVFIQIYLSCMVSLSSTYDFQPEINFNWQLYHYNFLDGNPIALKSVHDRYISVNQDNEVNANLEQRNISEIFCVENIWRLRRNVFKLALKSYQGKYIGITSDGTLNANAVRKGTSEIFTIKLLNANKVVLKSRFNKYLVAKLDGQLNAISNNNDNGAIFKLERPKSALTKTEQQRKYDSLNGSLITLKTDRGRYVMVETNGKVKSMYGRDKAENLKVETLGDFNIALKLSSGKYLIAGSMRPVYVKNRYMRRAAVLRIVFIDENRVAFRSQSGRYVAALHYGPKYSLVANRKRRGSWEIFTLKLIPVNGGISEWSSWTTCDVTCGGGDQTKSRQCNNPTPVNGGADCVEQTSTMQRCNIQACSECIEDGDCDNTAVCSSGFCQCKDFRVIDAGITMTYAVVGTGTGKYLTCEETIRIKNINVAAETCYQIIPTEIFELNDVPISMEFEYKGNGRIHLAITNYEFLSDCGKQALSNDDSHFIKFDSLARFTSNIVNGNELKIIACAFSGSELLIRRIEFVPKTDLSEVIDTVAECREDMATVFYKDTLRTQRADGNTFHISDGELEDLYGARWTIDNTLPCRGRNWDNFMYTYNHCKSELDELGHVVATLTFREFRENDL